MTRALRVLAVLAGACLLAPSAPAQQLTPRTPIPQRPVVARPFGDVTEAEASIMRHRLTVKFSDAARVRVDAEGQPVSTAGVDLSAVRALAAAEGLTFAPLIDLPASKLALLEARGAARTGRAQPDLGGMMKVARDDDRASELERIGAVLQQLAEVEYAYIQTLGTPPPGDIAPTTPDLSGNQSYTGGGAGMNADYANSLGIDGSGVRVTDCEYGWVASHEDLVDVDLNPEPGQTPVSTVAANGWDEHGTAVVGTIVPPDNGYGVSGMARGAEMATYPEWTVQGGFRRATCIASAAADSDPGDVVLLEMQSGGAGGFAPAEFDSNVFVVSRNAVDNGVIVVAAAGNGNQDLDSSAYAGYMAMGDSGAIIVGAGSSSNAHNKLSFSTYGSRVNVQGWGQSVFTLGYGSFAQYGGDKNQRYTSGFNGTSSASPFVATACALVQSYALATVGSPLSPEGMRQLLIDTGVPQGSGGNIGPFVDVEAAIDDFVFQGNPWTDLGGGLPGWFGLTPLYSTDGSLIAGAQVTHTLSIANPSSLASFVVGLSAIDAPFKGGVLVPSPDLVVPFQTGLSGSVSVQATWPAGVPQGTAFYHQWWIVDPAAVKGLSASNAIQGLSN